MLRDGATPEPADDAAADTAEDTGASAINARTSGATVYGTGADVDREAEDDEARLAQQLAVIFARSPRRTPVTQPARAGDDADDDDAAGVPATTRVTTRRFATALHHGHTPRPMPRRAIDLAEDEAGVDDAVHEDHDRTVAAATSTAAGRWLRAARRRRAMEKLGAAASWLATVAVGMAIIAVAAYVVFGDIADVRALHGPTRPL